MTIEGRITILDKEHEWVCPTGDKLVANIDGFDLKVEDYGQNIGESVVGRYHLTGDVVNAKTDLEGDFIENRRIRYSNEADGRTLVEFVAKHS